MSQPLPTVLVPGLLCSARLYSEQVPQLWHWGPVMVADHRHDDTMAAIAARCLAHAPPRFALAGLSLGGYIAFEIVRQAAERVVKLALISTSARPDTPEQKDRRRAQIAAARAGRFLEIPELLFPLVVDRSRQDDDALRRGLEQMAVETGPDVFVRHQEAIMSRPDSRPDLAAIRCPTLVIHGAGDELIDPEHGVEIAAGIDGAELVVLDGCGHVPTLERPREVSEALGSLLGDRDRRGGGAAGG